MDLSERRNTIYENKVLDGTAKREDRMQHGTKYCNDYARKQSTSSIVSETNSESSYNGANKKARMERRKSSIVSILSSQEQIRPVVKYKPCLPIPCQRIVLRLVIPIAILFTWLILIPPVANGIYKEIANISSVQVNNISLSEKLLSTVNLSNKFVQCPEMYIFSPDANSCRPKCGAWSGCGTTMYFVERYLLIIVGCGGIASGTFGIITLMAVSKEWQLKQFAIIVTALMGVMLSPIFSVLDLPGPRYIYCWNEEVTWDEVKMGDRIHVQVYTSILHYVSASFLIWLFIALLNSALLLYFPLSARLQSQSFLWKMFAFESIFGFGIPFLLIGGYLGIGERYNLENVIQHPSMENSRGDFFAIHFVILTLGASITTVLLILYKTRIQRLQLQTRSSAPLQMSELEKRFIILSICYMSILLLRGVYTAWLGFASKWEAQNLEYAACITLESSYSRLPFNSTLAPRFPVKDLLPISLHDQVSECDYPCVIPFRTVLLRLTWIIVFSITTVPSSLKFWYSILLWVFRIKRKGQKSLPKV